MGPVLTSRRVPLVVAVAAVAFAFWPALFGGGSLVSADIVATAPPFDSYQSADFTLENGPGDPINIHSHWGSLAEDLRAGDAGWWNPSLAGGQPTMKGGAPIFDLPYLVTPTWYAPGLVAALRALAAIGLTFGFLRTVGLSRVASLAGGLAFGFSGFMVGWLNWPHSSVAALAPGLLWAIERALRDPRPWRAVPLGLVAALMVWSNFPSVLIYLLLGVAVYAAIRSVAEWRGEREHRAVVRAGVVAALGVGVAALLAGPHLVGFSEYIDWADTSHRVGNPDDSSAGVAHLLTAVAPAVWGSDAAGAPWFGEGNWVEFNAHMGAAVCLLAVLGLVAGVRDRDRQRRSVAIGITALVGLGVTIAYLGGPVGVLLSELTGSQGGLMTRAKVLFSLGVALGAGFGVERLVAAEGTGTTARLRRDLVATAVVLAVALVALAPSIREWLDTARGLGVLRETIAASTSSLLALGVTVALIGARLMGRITRPVVGWALVGVIGFEVLSFAMPVPTIVGRSERLAATLAHEDVVALLGPGERLAGEGRTFFPSTTQLFDIDDARGQLLKSTGYQALLRAVDPEMLTQTGGGTPTYPNIAEGTDPTSPVWDALSIGAWAQFPDAIPWGGRDDPALVADDADPAVQALAGATTVPEGGLRAVLVRAVAGVPGFIDVRVTTDDGVWDERRWIDPADDPVIGVAIAGEHLVEGSTVSVQVGAPESTMFVGVDQEGRVPVGTVAGDDDLELVRVGDVLLFDRPVDPVRLVDAVVVEPDPISAAAEIAGRAAADRAVVRRDVGLPDRSDPAAVLSVTSVDYETADRIVVRAETDRPALLVVGQAYYPGWRAVVDGESTAVVLADGAFVGVPVGPGSHDIELTFRPRHLGTSLLSIALGLVVSVALLFHARRRGDLRSSNWSGR